MAKPIAQLSTNSAAKQLAPWRVWLKDRHARYNSGGFYRPQHVDDCMAVVSAKAVPLRSVASQRLRPMSPIQPRRCTMAVTVKKIVVWQTQVQNKPGGLSGVLAPLAEAAPICRW